MDSKALGECFDSCSGSMQPVLISARFGLVDTAPKVARFRRAGSISPRPIDLQARLASPTEKVWLSRHTLFPAGKPAVSIFSPRIYICVIDLARWLLNGFDAVGEARATPEAR